MKNLTLEDDHIILNQNMGIQLFEDTVSHPTRTESYATLLQNPQNSQEIPCFPVIYSFKLLWLYKFKEDIHKAGR
jgi:hypothetical protein